MPEEYVNYVVTRLNGTLWAKIDGTYPMQILTHADSAPSCVPSELPMLYPIPPNATNIHLKVDESELDWSNWLHKDTHHTAIGDWNMIHCVVAPVSEQFTIKIHYEHPVEQVNSSYIFLYDLNISPYLSTRSPNSTAYFTIRMDTEVSNLKAYTATTDTEWNPIVYTAAQEGNVEVVTIEMHSVYSKSLLGDLVIMFSNEEIPEFPSWTFLPLFTIATILIATYLKKRKERKKLMKITDLALKLIAVLLSSAVATTLLIGLAEANFIPLPELPSPIYIRNDGSVEPSTAPLKRTGNTYTFTDNISNTIEIQRSNTVIDGNGFTLSKPTINTEGLMMPIGWLPGIHIFELNDIAITNVAFEGCITGITVENSSSITISQNTIKEANAGIVVMSSFKITIIGNNMTLSNWSFATGIHLLPSNPDASYPFNICIKENLIVGNSNQVPISSPQPDEYGIWGGFSNSIMTGNCLTRINGIALYCVGSNNLIVGNNFERNNEGIFFSGYSQISANNTIYGNNFNHNSENVVVPFIRDLPANFWDNGKVGNYWSDYKGIDADGDGIGDSPYIIENTYTDYEQNSEVTVEEGRDNYPSMTTFDVDLVNVKLTQPAPSPSAPSIEPKTEEPFPTLSATVASIVITAAVGVSLQVYFKKRKR